MTTPATIVSQLLEAEDLDSPEMTMPGYREWIAKEQEFARKKVMIFADQFFSWLDEGYVASIWVVKSLTGASNDYYVVGTKLLHTDGTDYARIDAERDLCIQDENPACGKFLARQLERYNIHFSDEPPVDGIKIYEVEPIPPEVEAKFWRAPQ